MADQADAEWARIHSAGELPSDMPEVEIPTDAVKEGRIWICRVLTVTGMAKGTGEARRLIEQGGVSLNGDKVTDTAAEFPARQLKGAVLRVGARRYVRLSVEG
jgi:tyrosyl-tRNA synthetase